MQRATESSALSWLRRVGVPVPDHLVIKSAEVESPRLHVLGPPWVVKPDVALGGKGQRGLVRICADERELRAALTALPRMVHAGTRAVGAVVERYVEGDEFYLSISLDERCRGPLVRLAATGGERFDASQAAQIEVGLREGLDDHHVAALVRRAGIVDRRLARRTGWLLDCLWRVFSASEATLLELNPLRWNGTEATAVGLALEFDDHARPGATPFRPTVLTDESFGHEPTARELLVADADAAEPHRPTVRFFELEGDVALTVVGGGAALLCFDYLTERGVRPACYADYSPGAGIKKLASVVEAGLGVPGIRGALFGAVVVSLVDATELAAALVRGIEAAGVDAGELPIVARIAGPGEVRARELLRQRAPAVMVVGREGTLEDACDRLVKRVRATGGAYVA